MSSLYDVLSRSAETSTDNSSVLFGCSALDNHNRSKAAATLGPFIR